jgi:hypothetical protein
MRNTAILRNLLKRGPVMAASIYDPLSARMAELAGFDALHLTGFGLEATQIGAPDMGLISMTELSAHAARIVDAVGIPVLSDVLLKPWNASALLASILKTKSFPSAALFWTADWWFLVIRQLAALKQP